MTDEELERFIKEDIEKDITQEETIDDEQVNEVIGGMGFLWDAVTKKLQEDGICFVTKRKVDFSSEKLHVLQATNTEKGVVAFVGVSEEGLEKLKKEKGELKNE